MFKLDRLTNNTMVSITIVLIIYYSQETSRQDQGRDKACASSSVEVSHGISHYYILKNIKESVCILV
jgi:hypothetical protein